jgi:fructose/tagatose bisphosphate aldolase
VQKFSEGRTSIEDEHRVGRPVVIATPETLQGVEDIIRADRRVTIDAVATAIGCSHGQAYNIMHEGLGFPLVTSKHLNNELYSYVIFNTVDTLKLLLMPCCSRKREWSRFC